MTEHVIGEPSEFPEGSRKMVLVDGREIAVFRSNGEFHAVLNWCPHQAGPLCEGFVTGTTCETYDRESLASTLEWVKEGEVVVCPWHGWQFDMLSGDSLSDPGISVPTYDVAVEDDAVVLSL